MLRHYVFLPSDLSVWVIHSLKPRFQMNQLAETHVSYLHLRHNLLEYWRLQQRMLSTDDS